MSKKYEKYQDYLLSNEWREKREKVLHKRRGHCAICGGSENLNLHHYNYNTLFHEEDNDFYDLVILCADCHKEIHEYLKQNQDRLYSEKARFQKMRMKYREMMRKEFEEFLAERYPEFKKDIKGSKKQLIYLKQFMETLFADNNDVVDFCADYRRIHKELRSK